MAKSVKDKLTEAKALYDKRKKGASEKATPDEMAGVRKALKKLKRAQRRARVVSLGKAKVEDMEKRRLANSEKAKERSDSKEAADAAEVAAIAEAQARKAAETKTKEAEEAKVKKAEETAANEETVKDTTVPQEEDPKKESNPEKTVGSEDETQEIPPEVLQSIVQGKKE